MQFTRSGISVIWVIFAVFFGILSCSHFKASKTRVPPFELTTRPDAGIGQAQILGADVDQIITDFAADFNRYLSTENEASTKGHRLAAGGYLLAALTALFSLGLQRREACDLGQTP